MHKSTYVCPDAFTRMKATVQMVLSRFGAKHIHAFDGDVTGRLGRYSVSWRSTWIGSTPERGR
jgi:hypothetical protein